MGRLPVLVAQVLRGHFLAQAQRSAATFFLDAGARSYIRCGLWMSMSRTRPKPQPTLGSTRSISRMRHSPSRTLTLSLFQTPTRVVRTVLPVWRLTRKDDCW
jgi:hypothetical protein